MTYSENLNSKKFILALVIIVLNFVLMMFRIIGDSVYSTVVLATIAAYLASNVMAQHVDGTTTVNEVKAEK